MKRTEESSDALKQVHIRMPSLSHDGNGSLWREAILAYLNGIWSGDDAKAISPGIVFDNVCLYLELASKIPEYQLHGYHPARGPVPEVPNRDILCVKKINRAEVETALARFVKNDQIRQLCISGFNKESLPEYPGGQDLMLTKGEQRSTLLVHIVNQKMDW